MCTNPASHEGKTFGCRKCWQCIENRTQDWVGRCIAQSKTSTRSYFVTLTYGGGDHERATVLTYSDVQKFFKRLRKAGHQFRYLVAGEYGSMKGRAHWHVCLFFDGPGPEVEVRKDRYENPFWHHGHSYWDDVSSKSARYVCKYMHKDEADDERQNHFAMSKKPPIGTEYFQQMALDYAKRMIAPPDLMYSFNENRNKEGKKVQHYMHGATAREFLAAFVAAAGSDYGTRIKQSDVVDDYLDKLVKYAPDPVLATRKVGAPMKWKPREDAPAHFDEPRNVWFTEVDGIRHEWRPIKNTEEWAWQSVDGRIVRFEQSERYKHLQERAARFKAQLEGRSRPASPPNGGPESPSPAYDPLARYSELFSRSSRLNAAEKSELRNLGKRLSKRPPMRGDQWSEY